MAISFNAFRKETKASKTTWFNKGLSKNTLSSKQKIVKKVPVSAHEQMMTDMLTEIYNSVVKLRKKEARKTQQVSNEITCENPKLLVSNSLTILKVKFQYI